MRHYSSWEQPNYFHNYINKLEYEHLNYHGKQKRVSMPVRYRQTESDILAQHNRLKKENKSRSI